MEQIIVCAIIDSLFASFTAALDAAGSGRLEDLLRVLAIQRMAIQRAEQFVLTLLETDCGDPDCPVHGHRPANDQQPDPHRAN